MLFRSQMEEATRIEPDFFKHEIDLDSSDKNKPQSKSQQQKIDQFLNEALGEEKNKLLFSAENMDGSLLKNWVSQDLGSCGSRPRGLGSCSVNITNDGFPIYQAVSTSYFENQ